MAHCAIISSSIPPGAAYTPISLAHDGRILTQNNGHLFVVGDDDESDR